MSLGRREFLAGLGGLGLGIGLGGVSHWLPLASPHLGPDWAPGRERFVPSTCLLCPSHCGIRGRIVDGNLVAIAGNPLHPVSQGGLCPKGLAGIQLLYHPGRLTGPVERTGPPGSDEFRRISWEEALERVTTALSGLRDGGRAKSAAWLVGSVPGIMGELIRTFAGAFGTDQLISEGDGDGSARVLDLCQGIDAPPAFDLASSDFILSFGAALSEAWWGLPQSARARAGALDRRPRWVQVDCRHSRTAARAGEWVPVRPGSYGALALGIAYILLKEGMYDAKNLGQRVIGLEDGTDGSAGFRTLVLRHGRTDDVARRTGVKAETLVSLAKSFGTAERPVAIWDRAVSWRQGGLSDALTIHALNILVSSLDRPGGVLVQPPLPVQSLQGGRPPDAGARVPTGQEWAAKVASGESEIEALFLYYANPVASSPTPDAVRTALDKIPLVVSFSPFLDETARCADLVLPDHTYLERWQDAPAPASVPIPVWGIVQPMVTPRHETKATGDFILAVASALGGDVAAQVPWSSVEEIVRQRGESLAAALRGSALVPEFRRGELRELEARGWWIPHRLSAGEFWESLRESGGWFDPFYDYEDRSAVSRRPDGRVVIFPAEARDRIVAFAPERAEGLPVVPSPDEGPDRDYPLQLIPYPVMTLASGGTPLMPWLLENLGVLTGDAWDTWIEIHPETARELRLETGKRVRVESKAGSFEAPLRLFEGAQPGVLNVPYGLHSSVAGWGQTRATNPLHAVGLKKDPESGLPDWYSTWVRVLPA